MEIECRHTITFDGGWDTSQVRKALRKAKRTVLVAHTNADGDAVGSVTGMFALLRHIQTTQAFNHSNIQAITPMLPDGVPDDLDWLPGADLVLSGKEQPEQCREAIVEADLVLGLDISGWGRTGCLEQALRASMAYKMLVDHHIGPEREGMDCVVSEPEISSTCELVYWLMRDAFGPEAISTDAATCLFTGLCTDTGTFCYSNTRQSLYMAAADLLTYGIDPMEINRQIKNVFTEQRLKFFGHAMAERLTLYREPQVALMVLTAKEIADYGVTSSELTGLINEVMKLREADCGILVREEEGHVRLSLRSKQRYDVNRIASDLFGGGGHQRAAGATSTLPLDATVTTVKQYFRLEE